MFMGLNLWLMYKCIKYACTDSSKCTAVVYSLPIKRIIKFKISLFDKTNKIMPANLLTNMLKYCNDHLFMEAAKFINLL